MHPQVENAIRTLSGVIDVAVVGIPHEKWGEVPKAFVVKAENASIDEEISSTHAGKIGFVQNGKSRPIR